VRNLGGFRTGTGKIALAGDANKKKRGERTRGDVRKKKTSYTAGNGKESSGQAKAIGPR